jgi:lipopolysaccharide transport system ATP-binding protein
MNAITVANLGKAYKQYPTRWSRLAEWLDPRPNKPRHQLHWVLQDLNFSVQTGEAVGIVGVNGAGKSTLLKMITGTTQPTTGSVQINGRVAALLELGMGFHPDFTGRQNTYMACQLVGLSSDEIINLMPSIEQFAGIGDYFDQPVRIYSSGMQARVAFAAATATSPNILIVDEALSVGDIKFQAKCMQRMQTLLKQGTAVLFVSHALNQVRQFCSKALYLSNGHVKAWGEADKVCDLYQNDLAGGGNTDLKPGIIEKESVIPQKYSIEPDETLRENSAGKSAGGTLDLECMWFEVFDKNDHAITSCKRNQEIIFRACIKANHSVPEGASIGLLIADKSGYPLLACNTNYYDVFLPAMVANSHSLVEWKFKMPFTLGEFRIDIGIREHPEGVFYDRIFCARTLTVAPGTTLLKKNFGGYLFIDDMEIAIRPL